jgi:hypothetical protein
LATQKTPLSQAASPEPGQRSQKTAQRSKVARNRLIVGGVVALVVVAAIVFLTTRGGRGGIIGALPLGEPDRPVPEFAFEMKGVAVEPTVDGKEQHAAAEDAATIVREELDELYVLAFLDPESWGDTGAIEDFFTGDAADQLEGDTAALTLGVDAGDTYEYVEPTDGTLKVRVLTSANGALMAQADAKFEALAEHTDGSFTTVTSTGTFFFVKDGDDWRIQSYRVDRDEEAAEAPSPAATSTASGDA